MVISKEQVDLLEGNDELEIDDKDEEEKQEEEEAEEKEEEKIMSCR